jgi:hypothetical protein
MPSIYVMGGKTFKNYKVVCQMHTRVVFKMVVEIMFLVVKQCIFNQTQGYWLLSNALNVAISIGVCIQN